MCPMLFFFNDTATTEIYTLSLHDALPIYSRPPECPRGLVGERRVGHLENAPPGHERSHDAQQDRDSARALRSEEHTSELQSPCNLVCRLLLEKKKRFRDTQTSSCTPSTSK